MSQSQVKPPEEAQPEPDRSQPQMPSFQSINSIAPSDKEKEEERKEEEGEELEVVEIKEKKGIDHEQILRMFNEQEAKDQEARRELQLMRKESKKRAATGKMAKKNSVDDKRASKQNNAHILAQTEKSNRIKQRIESYCRKYKSMYRPSIYDSKLQRFRYECKEKLFFCLCFGMEEMREMSETELSQKERQLVANDPYEVCRRVASVVDLEMLKGLNQNDRHEVHREYKMQWQTLLNNTKDENNLELKRKLITRQLAPSHIPNAAQIDFFTTSKREDILEKQKRYIAEFTVDTRYPQMQKENEQIISERPKVEPEVQPEENLVPKTRKSNDNKYLDESVITHLEELLSNGQVTRMERRLEEDLQGRSQKVLLQHFRSVFHA